jgi:phage I-like protein
MATAVPIWDGAWRQTAQKMGGDPPTWIQIFPYPTYDATIDGKKTTLVTDEASQRAIVEYFDQKGNAATIDYEHASTSEGVFYAPAAGRIPRLVAGGKLGLLGQCEWNEDGLRDLSAGRYYYDSPTFWWSPDDMRIYIFDSLALTNRPASFNRPYMTDHNDVDYASLLSRTAAKGGAAALAKRPLKLKCAKGDTKMADTTGTTKTLSDSVLSSMRYAFDLTLTTTGNELRKLLQTMIELIPANDDPIFMVDEGQKEKGPKTVGQLLGFVSQKDAASTEAAVAAALEPIRFALAVTDEKADGAALAQAALKLKATSVPIEEHRAVQKQLTEAQQRTSTDRLSLKIAECREKGIVILPFNEAEAKRLAAQSIELAISYLEALPPLDFSSQASGTAPAKPAELPATQPGSSSLLTESQQAEKRTREIMKAQKVDYVTASRLRLEEESDAKRS